MDMMREELLELFNVVLIEDNQVRRPFTDAISYGIVLDFEPTHDQMKFLERKNSPLNVRTLFTKEERETASAYELITKQVLHYVEVYGLGMPGLFDLEVSEGKKVTIRNIRGVTIAELDQLVLDILYSNKPMKDVPTLVEVVKAFNVEYDINRIQNNEARVVLFDILRDRFESGDDAVRYIVWKATGSTMLIKNRATIMMLETLSDESLFLEKHMVPLSQVFNRHKKLIMALKRKNKSIVNKISRLSKVNHIPLIPNLDQRFMSEVKNNPGFDIAGALKNVSFRTKLKLLNLLEVEKASPEYETFMIRDGKAWTQKKSKYLTKEKIGLVEKAILANLREELELLRTADIILDPVIQYGLPISRKQTLGQIPFGTRITLDSHKVSAGIFWKDSWGARDLDLSAIDEKGERTGWGGWSAYNNEEVKYSGDVTSAYGDGAMEFMTSSSAKYALYTNVYSGAENCEAEIVFGTTGKNTWIENVVFREKITFAKRGMVTGFVDGKTFIVYSGQVNSKAANFGDKNTIMERGMIPFWTVNRLFDALDIFYDTEQKDGVEYNIDLRNATFDALEKALGL